MDDLESKIKQKLLEGLIEHMHDRMGSDLGAKFPQAEVKVAADSPDELKKGLDHAKEIVSDHGMPHGEPDGDEGSDEDRLMALLGEDDDDKED
jgi:hypothetical protein